MSEQNEQARKHQIAMDTFRVITNRILDVVIMFLSVFVVIYLFNGQPAVALGCLIADLIIISFNNGVSIFHQLKSGILKLKEIL